MYVARVDLWIAICTLIAYRVQPRVQIRCKKNLLALLHRVHLQTFYPIQIVDAKIDNSCCWEYFLFLWGSRQNILMAAIILHWFYKFQVCGNVVFAVNIRQVNIHYYLFLGAISSLRWCMKSDHIPFYSVFWYWYEQIYTGWPKNGQPMWPILFCPNLLIPYDSVTF